MEESLIIIEREVKQKVEKATKKNMSLLKIILLGVIQGLTEFLPVSSSGHLVLFQNLFGFNEDQLFMNTILHVGTLISLFIFLRREISGLIQSFWKFCMRPKKNFSDSNIKLIFYLAIASLPTALIGYFLYDFFESLFSFLRSVGVALLITGGYLLLTQFTKEKKRGGFFIP